MLQTQRFAYEVCQRIQNLSIPFQDDEMNDGKLLTDVVNSMREWRERKRRKDEAKQGTTFIKGFCINCDEK